MPATPTKASRASSSADRISTGWPVAASTAATSSAPFSALRMAAVATARITVAPCARAVSSWPATTTTTSAILPVPIRPVF